MLSRQGLPRSAGYIKISEAEIADDYPEPTPYEKVSIARLTTKYDDGLQMLEGQFCAKAEGLCVVLGMM